MTSHPLGRAIAVLVSAALLASLAEANVAAPASAAKPRCQGQTATIVGTRRSEIIRGTARRDVIVAKGGNDRIYGRGGNDVICAGGGNDVVFGGAGADRLWGQLGHDRLLGNAGPDFLAGQVGNDRLVGGTGVDTCYQGTGTGSVSTCEGPAPPPAPPPASPPPPPDIDNDGIPDSSDACPSQGDEGYGVDGSGCPFANGFNAKCVADGGTYSEPPGYVRCDWVGPYPGVDLGVDYYQPLCQGELGSTVAGGNPSAPAYIYCNDPT